MTQTERAELLYTLALAAIKQGDVTIGKGLLQEAIDTHPQHFEAAVRSLEALEAQCDSRMIQTYRYRTALWFLPFVLPIALWVAWSDMKFMKIPNKAVLALVAVFAVVGLAGAAA